MVKLCGTFCNKSHFGIDRSPVISISIRARGVFGERRLHAMRAQQTRSRTDRRRSVEQGTWNMEQRPENGGTRDSGDNDKAEQRGNMERGDQGRVFHEKSEGEGGTRWETRFSSDL